jgi:hypothetical protein
MRAFIEKWGRRQVVVKHLICIQNM